jgi:hypothetical protein
MLEPVTYLRVKSLLRCTFAVLFMVTPVRAQQVAQPAAPAVDATALAKQSQNPVGSLVSVPFQFNFNTGGDLGERTLLNVNFQPVIPFRLTDRWNVIARTIVPLESVPGDAGTRFSGVGLTRTVVFNRRPMNLGISYNYNIEHPAGTAGEQLRFTVTLLYPR